MRPKTALPLPNEFTDADKYIESLLDFCTSSQQLQTFCGGVHILDFFTREPDLFTTILPETWRTWFKERSMEDILDLLMREDLTQFKALPTENGSSSSDVVSTIKGNEESTESSWRDGSSPPLSLVDYIQSVRSHSLSRSLPLKRPAPPPLSRPVAIGMKVKKIHEVSYFSAYVSELCACISSAQKRDITHIIDFGSGQNYLGRSLASAPYGKNIVAVESKEGNIVGARGMDVGAGLAEKEKVMRDKRKWRLQRKTEERNTKAELKEERRKVVKMLNGATFDETTVVPDFRSRKELATKYFEAEGGGSIQYLEHRIENGDLTDVIARIRPLQQRQQEQDLQQVPVITNGGRADEQSPISHEHATMNENKYANENKLAMSTNPESSSLPSTASSNTGTTQHKDASQPPVPRMNNTITPPTLPTSDPNHMIVSLHSCGNLSHHGLRTLVQNPSVIAVALIGCCYNLLTERIGPPTYKHPQLRPGGNRSLRLPNTRLETLSSAHDPHGFPISETLAEYRPKKKTQKNESREAGKEENNNVNVDEDDAVGVRLNITHRMMAVQAPQNWTSSESEAFFKRHFYRALLQRIFLDRGVVSAPSKADDVVGGRVMLGKGEEHWATEPVVIGSLRKECYESFVAYVRGAVAKLCVSSSFFSSAAGKREEDDAATAKDGEKQPHQNKANFIAERMTGLSDADIYGYEINYETKKKELSVVWSLMAFSAGVIESLIVVDRYLYLREQIAAGVLEDAWVEPVFDYRLSPRNLVIVGIKKTNAGRAVVGGF